MEVKTVINFKIKPEDEIKGIEQAIEETEGKEHFHTEITEKIIDGDWCYLGIILYRDNNPKYKEEKHNQKVPV